MSLLSLKTSITFILALLFFSILIISLTQLSSLSPNSSQPTITPSDRITQDQIKVYSNQIVLNVKDASWATFTPTGSMKPLFDEKSNALEIKPTSPSDIKLGDIIAYQSAQDATDIIIHRVINIAQDNQGIYYIVKGDNNQTADPQKVRFEQIQGVVVAIIY
ncbi:MAG: signal peptidase I [Candidatus Buchananbacteria bacterium RIFCSPHIGHO2_02_FULL_39_17]|uniref:Signal peptidase I n=1 Tax=Candidatus Buchananbacteria bacterium RIFCSPLOWO2_01_FULL_40_23b TaxID=1797544 RepID=A0A1G1YLE6_9BACT|nr:MAG: signal peptidase I [Candidatus Buchananbacteria bacterium RIFCSPHIGHO2_02_FULL_39_17]OGY53162.1 MAG: signal peptidase I [Candidatus Buchananbacteria bacterium RIFCSPLOWO2_01_FULL_40_23b]